MLVFGFVCEVLGLLEFFFFACVVDCGWLGFCLFFVWFWFSVLVFRGGIWGLFATQVLLAKLLSTFYSIKARELQTSSLCPTFKKKKILPDNALGQAQMSKNHFFLRY